MTDYTLVIVTVPDEPIAIRISSNLIEKKLAACVNIVSQVRSIYSWEDKICDETELLLYIKTKKNLFSIIEKEILMIHPYSVPEIIELEIKNGFDKYLNWIEENTTKV